MIKSKERISWLLVDHLSNNLAYNVGSNSPLILQLCAPFSLGEGVYHVYHFHQYPSKYHQTMDIANVYMATIWQVISVFMNFGVFMKPIYLHVPLFQTLIF